MSPDSRGALTSQDPMGPHRYRSCAGADMATWPQRAGHTPKRAKPPGIEDGSQVAGFSLLGGAGADPGGLGQVLSLKDKH